ncbi:MAG: DUF2924 domain-containing protein [Rhodospirillales bacterium]|nr:DUF2924 domain-containing protein [Rhodospirillales bacterium]
MTIADATVADALAAKLQALQQMTHRDLRHEWRRLYRSQPPKRVARDLLMLGIAWKLQELTHGGLRPAAKRRLARLASGMEKNGAISESRIERLKPGAKLIREWQGEVHQVMVLENGFEWRGQQWRSLSMIARQITQSHWSGPRFFGLSGKTAKVLDCTMSDDG